jgi:hypothetical protein
MGSYLNQGWRHLLAVLAGTLAIASCGGGVGSGGTGGSVPSVSVGTVTGFGSILVDGTRFDDRDASVEIENGPGTSVIGEVRLGHRVEIEFEIDGVARTVHIEAEVTGAVTAVSTTGFTVLGQTIVVNTDAAAGPVTQFADGYTSLASVAVADVVEVHGIPRREGDGFVIQATRVEKKLALPAYLRVVGVVAELNASAATPNFKLGGLAVQYNNAVVIPAGRTLANGQSVVVLARPADLVIGVGGAPSVTAQMVRIKERANGPVEAYVGGAIANLNAAASSFDLGGLRVNYAGAVITPLLATLANGQYVQVRGSFATDGSLRATRVKIRDGRDEPEAELKGTVSGYNATTQRFSLRDATVDASTAVLRDCPAGGIADGLFVEVKGSLGATAVIATEIKCEDEPSGAVIEREGSASGVDTVARTFTLTPAGSPPLTVRWTALTFFRDVTPATLNGRVVEVEGSLVGSVLVARKVKLED